MHYIIAYRVVEDLDEYDGARPTSHIELETGTCDDRDDVRDRVAELRDQEDVREITGRELAFDDLGTEGLAGTKMGVGGYDFSEP